MTESVPNLSSAQYLTHLRLESNDLKKVFRQYGYTKTLKN